MSAHSDDLDVEQEVSLLQHEIEASVAMKQDHNMLAVTQPLAFVLLDLHFVRSCFTVMQQVFV